MHRTLTTALILIASLPASLEAGPGPQGAAVDPLGAGYLVQFSLGLLAVLAAVVALAWLLKRVGTLQRGVAGTVRALGGISLGPRERVVLIQVGEEQLLIGIAPGQVRTLHVLDQPIQTAQPDGRKEQSGSFSRRLAAVLDRSGTGTESSP